MSEIERLRLELANLRDKAANLQFSLLDGEHEAETVRIAGELAELELACLELEAQALGLVEKGVRVDQ